MKTLSPADVLNVIYQNNSVVLASCARFFQTLVFKAQNSTTHYPQLGPFIDITLPIVVHALSCLYHSDVEIQACGLSILTSLMDNGRLYFCISIW
jgi:hypothetical protein